MISREKQVRSMATVAAPAQQKVILMRTTVTLDRDVAAQLQGLAHRRRKPFKVILNETIRKGLGHWDKPSAVELFRVRARNCHLRPGLDDRRFNQLADELEAEAAGRKLARRR